MSKKIVILGGGIGGLATANLLRKSISKDNEIVIIDRKKNHIFNPSFLWLMTGLRTPDQIQKPLALLEKKGIRFLNEKITKIDFENHTVITSSGEERFDYLAIALGADTFPEKLSGFTEAAFNLYDLSGVEKIKKQIEQFNTGKIVILISSSPFKCPAAPYEAGLILSEYFKNSKNINIEIIAPEPLPMGVAGPEVGNMVVSMLKNKGINFLPQYQAVSIDFEKKKIFSQNEKVISYDLLIGIPPHGLPVALSNSPILGKSGWVKVNPKTMQTDIENIYALGDVTSIPLSLGKPLPKAGVFAHFQAEVAAHNIASKINGLSSIKEFDGIGYCFHELGDGTEGYDSGNFYTETKPIVNLKKPGKKWHWGKVLFEKWWLWKWF